MPSCYKDFRLHWSKTQTHYFSASFKIDAVFSESLGIDQHLASTNAELIPTCEGFDYKQW